jgi:hypothetical protein
MGSVDKKIEKLRRQMRFRPLTSYGVRFEIGRKAEQLRRAGEEEEARRLELLLTDDTYIRMRLRRNYALQIADEAAVQLMTAFPEAYPGRS